MKYARLSSENIVLETFVPPSDFSLLECFCPEVVAMFVQVPDEVQQNWIQNPDGTFSAPTQE
jgi:hypothetical protein